MIDYDLVYECEEYKSEADETFVRSILDATSPDILGDGVFSVSFVKPETIQEANRQYRDIDSVTDILTFALDDCEEDFFTPEEEEKEWGDILICLERMNENAEVFAASKREELARLLIHGILHLSGLDHKTNDFATEPMLARQENILQDLKNLI